MYVGGNLHLLRTSLNDVVGYDKVVQEPGTKSYEFLWIM